MNTEIFEHRLKKYDITNCAVTAAGTVNVDGSVWLTGRNFKKLPFEFGIVNGNFYTLGCKNINSLAGMPTHIHGYWNSEGCERLNSLIGFNTKIQSKIYMDWSNIKSGGIGLILAGSAELHKPTGPFRIINAYLKKPEDIFECQTKLIEAGYEAYAHL